MAFWGIEVKEGSPYTHVFYKVRGRLHISQATLGFGTSAIEKITVQCDIDNKTPILLCSLLTGKVESFPLNLKFEEAEGVTFSVIGPLSVYLSGYYLNQSIIKGNDGTKIYSSWEDFGILDTDNSDTEEDDDDDDDGFIVNDDNLQVNPPPLFIGEVECGNSNALSKRNGALGIDGEDDLLPSASQNINMEVDQMPVKKLNFENGSVEDKEKTQESIPTEVDSVDRQLESAPICDSLKLHVAEADMKVKRTRKQQSNKIKNFDGCDNIVGKDHKALNRGPTSKADGLHNKRDVVGSIVMTEKSREVGDDIGSKKKKIRKKDEKVNNELSAEIEKYQEKKENAESIHATNAVKPSTCW